MYTVLNKTCLYFPLDVDAKVLLLASLEPQFKPISRCYGNAMLRMSFNSQMQQIYQLYVLFPGAVVSFA